MSMAIKRLFYIGVFLLTINCIVQSRIEEHYIYNIPARSLKRFQKNNEIFYLNC